MRIIKIKINKAEVNDRGYAKLQPEKEEVSREGKYSLEMLEDLGIQPNKDNCYDLETSKEEEYEILLDTKEDFDFWTSDFYFRLEDFKYLEVEETENGETICILTLQDGTEISVNQDSIEQLKAELEKPE